MAFSAKYPSAYSGQRVPNVELIPVREMAIEEDNEVRFIDFFVDSLDIEEMGFAIDHGENGRPAYHPKDLLKLYLY